MLDTNAKPDTVTTMDLVTLSRESLQRHLDRAAQVWGDIFPTPSLDFSLKGLCAGQALYGLWQIKLNVENYKIDPDDFLHDTIPHELAHLISYKLYGKEGTGHGRNWKSVMRALGLKPKRCHNLKLTPARKTKKFVYACSCRKHTIGSLKHKSAALAIIIAAASVKNC